jgi:uncharacterized protein YbcI
MSDGHAPGPEAVREEISRELMRVHEDSYGAAVSRVEIALHDSFVAVIMDIELSRAEETLIETGNADSVKVSREAFQSAVADTFVAIVERATGRRVTGFASCALVGAGPPWAMEVFRLDGRLRSSPRRPAA